MGGGIFLPLPSPPRPSYAYALYEDFLRCNAFSLVEIY